MSDKNLAWVRISLIVVGVGVASSLGVSACTVTTGGAGDGGPSSLFDSGAGDDSSTGTGTGTGDDAGSDAGQEPDTGTGTTPEAGAGASDAGSDGPSCTPVGTGNATCDSCIASKCMAQMCACTGDTTHDDAGIPGCISDLQCVIDCIAGKPDAGDASIPPGMASSCEMACSTAYTAMENQSASALQSCIANSCASPCAGM